MDFGKNSDRKLKNFPCKKNSSELKIDKNLMNSLSIIQNFKFDPETAQVITFQKKSDNITTRDPNRTNPQ